MSPKFTFEFVKTTIKEKGYKLVSTKYVNMKEPLDILCPKCAETFTCTFWKFKYGYYHEKCLNNGTIVTEERPEKSGIKYLSSVKWAKKKQFKQQMRIGKSCEKCGESNINLLDFAHYSRSDKKIGIAQNQSIVKLNAELSKGRLLCVWCHRLETKNENEIIRENNMKKWLQAFEIEPGINPVRCDGPLCNGKMRNSSQF